MKLTRIVLVLCALAAVLLAWNTVPSTPTWLTRRSHPSANTGDGSSNRKPVNVLLPQRRLPFLMNAPSDAETELVLPRGSRVATLLIAFSYADCYGKLADVAFWDEIQKRYGSRLHVTGVTSGGTVEKLRYFLVGNGVQIPVLYDSNEVVRGAILQGGYLTPAMVLLDSVGAVVDIEESRAGNTQLQAAYLMKLDRFVDVLVARRE